MNEDMRGKIRNKKFKQQIADFSGLRFGKITPTDIDCFIDFGNNLFIIAESKYKDTKCPYGQRLALERICDASHHPPDRVCCLFLLSHSTAEGDIDYAKTTVKEYRLNTVWRKPRALILFVDAVEIMRQMFLSTTT